MNTQERLRTIASRILNACHGEEPYVDMGDAAGLQKIADEMDGAERAIREVFGWKESVVMLGTATPSSGDATGGQK